MIASLAGTVHQVYTGVTLIYRDPEGAVRRTSFAERTNVHVYPMEEAEICRYAGCGEPMDKAGAYGIQGRGCVLVEGIDGNYHNVVGLPTCLLAGMLRQVGIDVLTGGQEGRP